MSTMDQDQEQKHVCRFCNKSFSSGKVLGGHMRCHGTKNSEKKKLIINNKSEKNGERSGYGLRVNPKKSSRLSGGCSSNYDDHEHDLELSSGQDIFCQVCGKGFDSMRALFGHMRHHSGKRRKEEVHCKECGRGFESLRALTGHMKSHSEKRFLGVVSREKLFGEASRLVRKKRSSRSLRRYKISPNCSSFSNLSESSSGGGGAAELEHDQEILQEAALCLLMLSRGVHCWDEFCFSEKNESSPFEGNSPNGIVAENGDGWIKVVKKPRLEKLELFDEKKVSEFNVNGFVLESDDDDEEEEEEKTTSGSFEASIDDEIGKDSQDGMGIINSDEVEYDENQREVLVSGLINLGSETFDNSDSSKRSGYKCRTCNKIFHSHQALGGHQTIHRSSKNNNNNFPTFQFDAHTASPSQSTDVFPGIEAKFGEQNSMEVVVEEMDKVTMTRSYETSNNNKEHKCPICFKVFGSGQALGGHKRAHIVKDSEVEPDQITLMKQEVCNISDVLGDLSVSMTLGNEANSWWVKNDHKHEVLVGLMPN